jgi:hypothetical protein
MSIYIFSYGSLRNPRSRMLTLPGERFTQETTLRKYVRKFNAPVNGYLYLNIAPRDDGIVPGTLIGVSREELEKTKIREPGYDCVEVFAQIADKPNGLVFAFIAPDKTYPELKIPQSYLDTCLANLPPNERKTWLSDSIVENEIEDDSLAPVYANAVRPYPV